MLKGLGDIGNLMKMQMQLKDTQKKMKKMETTAVSSNGWVTATVNGEFEILKIVVDEEKMEQAIKNPAVKTIANEIQSAVNKAMIASKKSMADKMKELTSGLDIPGLSNFMG